MKYKVSYTAYIPGRNTEQGKEMLEDCIHPYLDNTNSLQIDPIFDEVFEDGTPITVYEEFFENEELTSGQVKI